MPIALTNRRKLRTLGSKLLKYKSIRSLYDAILKDQDVLLNKLQIRCIYSTNDYLIYVDEPKLPALILALNSLEIPFIDEQSTQIFLTAIPLMMNQTELKGHLLPHFKDISFIDLFQAKKKARYRSAKLYLTDGYWSSDEGKKLLECLTPLEGERRPVRKIQLGAPYVGVIYMRLWLDEIQHNDRNVKQNKGDDTELHAPKYFPAFDPLDGRLKFQPIKQQQSKDMIAGISKPRPLNTPKKNSIPNKHIRSNEHIINSNEVNTSNKAIPANKDITTKEDIIIGKNQAYYLNLHKTQKALLEKAQIQSQAIEALVETVTSGFTSLHEIVHNLNESVHSLVMRMDLLDSNVMQNTKLQALSRLQDQGKTLLTKSLVATRPIQSQNIHPQKYMVPVEACEPKLKEKSRKVKEMKMPNRQQEPKREQESAQAQGGTKKKSKIILKERKMKNMKKRDLSLSKSPEAVKRQRLQVPTQTTQIMNVLAELRQKIPMIMSLGQK